MVVLQNFLVGGEHVSNVFALWKAALYHDSSVFPSSRRWVRICRNSAASGLSTIRFTSSKRVQYSNKASHTVRPILSASDPPSDLSHLGELGRITAQEDRQVTEWKSIAEDLSFGGSSSSNGSPFCLSIDLSYKISALTTVQFEVMRFSRAPVSFRKPSLPTGSRRL